MAASPKALLEWCRVACASYPGVEVRDASASFRDGLAFCAIIHRHRPDLIDFSSLSRGNVYQNNKLAFEVAEAKLGIPPLLDPQDMVATDAPDFLAVITYVSQFYNFFSRESPGPCRSWSSQVLNVTKVHKTLRSQKSLTELETSKEDGHAGLRPSAVCSLCFKPVHLIQKHLADGKVYHRGCFRCKVCRCVLLPGSYAPGSDRTSFTCTHHAADRNAAGVVTERLLGSAGRRPARPIQTGFYSLSGSAICSVPRYAEARRATEGGALPVPAPRRSLDSSVAPVAAPRSRSAQTMSDPAAGETARQSSPQPPGLTSPIAKSNHPWMAIVHPGPWTQLPPAPPPVPVPRSKPVSSTQTPWNRPRMPSLNPFEEEEEEEEEVDEAPKQEEEEEEASGTGPPAGPSEDGAVARFQGGEEPVSESERKAEGGRDGDARVFAEEREGAQPDPARPGNAAGIVGGEPADGDQSGPPHAAEPRPSEAKRSAALPRSLSVPEMPSERSESGAGADRSDSAREGESACKDNPFSERPKMSRSQTVQNLSSARGPAPGHGFPLIRRQVRTDRGVSTEDLQKQMRSLDGDLEALEQRGVELERSIRGGRTGKEEQMLTEWFGLVHEQHALLRRNKELVYLTKQQILEDRQADVEYKLRCLLNKPEKDWDQEDRGREQQLMTELVTIIEQRNQIVSSLDQDRERDEDTESTRNKSFQKDGPKKTRGKLNVFKMLNHKQESSKEGAEKKS